MNIFMELAQRHMTVPLGQSIDEELSALRLRLKTLLDTPDTRERDIQEATIHEELGKQLKYRAEFRLVTQGEAR